MGIVGELPSNEPNCYTDVETFLNPNTRTVLNLSTKQRYAVDRNIKEGVLQPDIKCNADAYDSSQDLYKYILKLRYRI